MPNPAPSDADFLFSDLLVHKISALRVYPLRFVGEQVNPKETCGWLDTEFLKKFVGGH